MTTSATTQKGGSWVDAVAALIVPAELRATRGGGARALEGTDPLRAQLGVVLAQQRRTARVLPCAACSGW
jgi:hypothetical protein